MAKMYNLPHQPFLRHFSLTVDPISQWSNSHNSWIVTFSDIKM